MTDTNTDTDTRATGAALREVGVELEKKLFGYRELARRDAHYLSQILGYPVTNLSESERKAVVDTYFEAFFDGGRE
jgi:hypothetical protein